MRAKSPTMTLHRLPSALILALLLLSLVPPASAVRVNNAGGWNWVWTPIPYMPARRYGTALWTGTEMIVWDGAYDPYYNRGERYNPVTGTWAAIPTAGAPDPRGSFNAVWTGSEMIVWYGEEPYPTPGTKLGGRYNPVTETWSPMASKNASVQRAGASAVWTGKEMIIWGGWTEWGYLNTGARYNPVTDTWTPMSTQNAPEKRPGSAAVWTGTEMIIWGGGTGTGARYNPATDTWTAISTAGAPEGQPPYQSAVWTGTELLAWGAYKGSPAGGRYNPVTDTWTPMSTEDAPQIRLGHAAVWTGSEMIVWGGTDSMNAFDTGGLYNPATDTWTPISQVNCPEANSSPNAVWTGTEMIIWGGQKVGGRYDPVTDTWTPVPGPGVPMARSGHKAVWMGNGAGTTGEMLIWGGSNWDEKDKFLKTGACYNPSTNSWTDISTTGAPVDFGDYTMVWTGGSGTDGEMLLWSGSGYGSRYNPSTDTWTDISTANAPAQRQNHSAVWTGTDAGSGEMLIWGGGWAQTAFNDGGRYDPATNAWTAILTTNAPSARFLHSAVWTGKEMIIWGGASNNIQTDEYIYESSGARYNPATGVWKPTSPLSAPRPRYGHSAVWTGSEMIIWGGTDDLINKHYLRTGARYIPSLNTWTPMSTVNAPEARYGYSVIWTGVEMVIWGGVAADGEYLQTGARYNPLTDTWTPISEINAPGGRSGHSAVWTGKEMLIWGGEDALMALDTGGRYRWLNFSNPMHLPLIGR